MEVYNEIKKDLGFFIFAIVLIGAILNGFGLSLDDSDKNGWTRSGVSVITDYKTGLQYLSRGGAMIPRVDINGKHIRIDKKGY